MQNDDNDDNDRENRVIVDRKGVMTSPFGSQLIVTHEYIALLCKVSKEGSNLLKSAQGVEKLEYRVFDWKNSGVALISKVDKDASGPDSGTNSSGSDSGTKKKSILKSDPDASDSDSSDPLSTTEVLLDGVWVNVNEDIRKRFKASHPDKDESKFCLRCAAARGRDAKYCCSCGFKVRRRK